MPDARRLRVPSSFSSRGYLHGLACGSPLRGVPQPGARHRAAFTSRSAGSGVADRGTATRAGRAAPDASAPCCPATRRHTPATRRGAVKDAPCTKRIAGPNPAPSAAPRKTAPGARTRSPGSPRVHRCYRPGAASPAACSPASPAGTDPGRNRWQPPRARSPAYVPSRPAALSHSRTRSSGPAPTGRTPGRTVRSRDGVPRQHRYGRLGPAPATTRRPPGRGRAGRYKPYGCGQPPYRAGPPRPRPGGPAGTQRAVLGRSRSESRPRSRCRGGAFQLMRAARATTRGSAPASASSAAVSSADCPAPTTVTSLPRNGSARGGGCAA